MSNQNGAENKDESVVILGRQINNLDVCREPDRETANAIRTENINKSETVARNVGR